MSSQQSLVAAGAGQTVSSLVPASVIAPIAAVRPASSVIASSLPPSTDPFSLPSHHPKYKMDRKYNCIIRPAQSGKTRTMQELMLEYERLAKLFYNDDESFLNIVICSKNLNLVKQTHARMKKELFSTASSDEDDSESDSSSADAKIDGDIFSWMTGTKDTNITASDLFGRIILEDVRMVICCAHKKRLEYVADLLALLDRCKAFKQRVNIWMDEADDYVKLWSSDTVNFHRFNKVNDIYLVSATMDAIVDKFKRIKVKPFASTYPACYHKTADAHVVEVGSATRDPVDYLKTVYAANKATLCVPGMRVFTPGDITVKSHDQIADFLVAEGFAVCILNGKEKCIRVPGMEKPLEIADHVPPGEIMEVGKTIACMYRDYKLNRFPFAITGKICLSRGITFQCEELKTVLSVQPDGTLTSSADLCYDFLFDAGIMPPMSDRATLYQCVSRVNGNIKTFRNYKKPVLYMSTETRDTIFSAEKIAENLATLVHTHNLSDVGVEEMNWAIHCDEVKYREELETSSVALHTSISHLEDFASMDELRSRWREILSESGQEYTNPRTPNQKDGVFVCSIGDKSEKQRAEAIRAKFGGESTSNWGSGLTTAESGEYIHRVYAGYDGDSVVFFLRWTRKV
jgi:hypothetical protein